MSSSITLEEKFEALMKICEPLQAQNKEVANQNAYLRRQLGESMRQRRREIWSSNSSHPSQYVRGEGEEDEPLFGGSSSEGGSPRHLRREKRPQANFNGFRVEILESWKVS